MVSIAGCLIISGMLNVEKGDSDQTAEQTELSVQISPLLLNELPLSSHLGCCNIVVISIDSNKFEGLPNLGSQICLG